MKKFFMILLVLFAVMMNVNKAEASTTSNIINLLEVDNLNYDEETGVIGSNDYIFLESGKYYTFIATYQFFGSACSSRASNLTGQNMGTIFKDSNDQSLSLNLSLRMESSKLYYATVNSSVDCYLLFTDLLVRDTELATLLTDQFIFYEGTRYEFQGFKKPLEVDRTQYTLAAEEISIYTDYDNPISVDTLKESVVAYDANDGMLDESHIMIDDQYTDNFGVGEHEVIFTAIDSQNNSTSLKVLINVLDLTAPVISGAAEITWDMSKYCPIMSDFKSYLSVTDNADPNISVDDIYIHSSNLSSYEVGVARQYVITFAVEDASDNVGYFNVLLNTVDNEAPVIKLKNITVKLSEVGEYLFRDLYRQVIDTISDNSGTYNLSYTISEIYGNGGFSGVFEVIIKATDNSGNSASEKATITIVDDFAPEIYIKSFMLETSTDNPYSTTDLKAELRHRLDARGILYDEVNLVSSNYFSNERKVGTYQVKYAYTYNGQTNYEVATITVEAVNRFNYAWLCLLLIPAAGISTWLFVKKRKKQLD